MHIIKSVGVLSLAKILGLVYGCIGLLFAPFFYSSASLDRCRPRQVSFRRDFAASFFAIALLYNLFARWVGGFGLEMDVRPQTPTAPYPIVPLTSPAPQFVA
jgi:hypothetical protein